MAGYDDSTLISQVNAIDRARLNKRHAQMADDMTALVESGGSMSDKQRGYLSAVIVRDEIAGGSGSRTRMRPMHKTRVNVSTSVRNRDIRRLKMLGWCCNAAFTKRVKADQRTRVFLASADRQRRVAVKSGDRGWAMTERQWAVVEKIRANFHEQLGLDA